MKVGKTVKNLPPEKKQTKPTQNVHQICPVCESTLISIKCKLVCPNCHHIVQACCD